MEFRICNVDTNLRRKINEQTSEGKIHRKKEIQIYKDPNKNKKRENEKHKKKDEEEFNSLLTKEKTATVDAIKGSSIEVDAIYDKISSNNDEYRGVFLDTKK